jgi:hypothetical protein
MTLWQRLRRLLGLSYVVRSEPGWDPPPDSHGNTTLADGTPIRLTDRCPYCAGSGWVKAATTRLRDGMTSVTRQPCGECRGTGRSG